MVQAAGAHSTRLDDPYAGSTAKDNLWFSSVPYLSELAIFPDEVLKPWDYHGDMRWTFARGSKSPFWNLAKRLARWTPFAVSFAIVYLIASAFGIAPAMTSCPTEPVKTVSLLNTNFEVGVGDCFYSPFDAESHVVVYASRRGDWFGTRIFEYKGEAAPELEIVDDRTVRIAVLPRVSGTAREVNVFDIYAQRREWRGVNFDYELRNTQERSK